MLVCHYEIAHFSCLERCIVWFLGSKSKSGSDSDVKQSTSGRKLPSSGAGISLKREAASVPSGIGLVLKKPRIASQTFAPLGRAIEADRRASPTTQVYLYEEIAAEGLRSCITLCHFFLHKCLASNIITFCVRYSRGDIYILVTAVCLSVCLPVPLHIPILLHGPGCKLGEW